MKTPTRNGLAFLCLQLPALRYFHLGVLFWNINRRFPAKLCGIVYIVVAGFLHGETPLITETTERLDIKATDLVREALQLALPEAEGLLLEELENPDLGEVERVEIQLDRMTLAIRLGQWERASEIYQSFTDEAPLRNRRDLLGAMLAWGERSIDLAELILSKVDPRVLSDGSNAWYWSLQGMILEHRGQLAESAESYDKAISVARDDQIPFLQLLAERNKILLSGADEGIETNLQIRIREFSGEVIAHQFAEQLMFSYLQRGAYDEALGLLEDRRESILLPRDQKFQDKFRLFEALILAEQGKSNASVLVQLMGSGQTADMLKQGLDLLLAQKDTLPADIDLVALLKRWTEQLPAHPIRVDILHALSAASLLSEDFETAKASAEAIIEEYPGSAKVESATHILAWVHWDLELYRLAALWFERYYAFVDEEVTQGRIIAKVGDAYFLAGDYDLALGSYSQAVQNASIGEELRATVQYQRILSLLSKGDLKSAILAIEESVSEWDGYSEDLRWKLEWNIAVAQAQSGKRVEAQKRLEGLMKEASLPESLRVRFQWLNVRLLFDLGLYEEVSNQVELALGQSVEESTLSREVRAELMLIRCRARLLGGESFSEIEGDLRLIRSTFPETPAAPETLWITSRALTREGKLVEAEEAMNKLAAAYEGTEWSRLALFESASLAEAREDYLQAANRLEAFVQGSPTDPMAFTARLNQADLLRKTGSLDEARVLLETVLQEFPDHPERYLAEMIRADLLAAASDVQRSEAAVSAYSRLLDLSGVPVDLQFEARYKLGKVYERLGDRESAIREWLGTALGFEEAEKVDLTTGPYWVSRSLLDIARLAEEQQNIESAKGALEKLINLGLPGQAAANSALRRLRSPLVGFNAVSP